MCCGAIGVAIGDRCADIDDIIMILATNECCSIQINMTRVCLAGSLVGW